MRILIKEQQDCVSIFSFHLGRAFSLGLYKNYPDNFNKILPNLVYDVLLDACVEVDIDKLIRDWLGEGYMVGILSENHRPFSEFLKEKLDVNRTIM